MEIAEREAKELERKRIYLFGEKKSAERMAYDNWEYGTDSFAIPTEREAYPEKWIECEVPRDFRPLK